MRDVGDRIAIRHEVKDPDGTLTAATVAVVVTKPDGTTTSPSVSTPSTGLYDASFTVDEAGVWRWTWTVSGAVIDVAHGSVDVADPGPGTYVSLATLRKALNVTGGDRDELLQMALETASRTVDEHCGRPPGGFYLNPTATARLYVAGDVEKASDGLHVIPVDELGSISGLVVEVGDGTTWETVSDIRTYPRNALVDLRPITALGASDIWYGTDLIQVTARWGWPAVPSAVAQATLILAHRFYKRKDTPEGIAGSTDFGAIRLARQDPDVQTLLRPFLNTRLLA